MASIETVMKFLDVIAEENGISRTVIAKRTGLSAVTVGKIADQLFENGIVVRRTALSVSGERESLVLTVNPHLHLFVLSRSAHVLYKVTHSTVETVAMFDDGVSRDDGSLLTALSSADGVISSFPYGKYELGRFVTESTLSAFGFVPTAQSDFSLLFKSALVGFVKDAVSTNKD